MPEDFLKCEDCGRVEESVKVGTCPYEEEINDELVTTVLCSECYYERCMDI